MSQAVLGGEKSRTWLGEIPAEPLGCKGGDGSAGASPYRALLQSHQALLHFGDDEAGWWGGKNSLLGLLRGQMVAIGFGGDDASHVGGGY